MECRRNGNDITPRINRRSDFDDPEGPVMDVWEFTDDDAATSGIGDSNIIQRDPCIAAGVSPSSVTTSSASTPNEYEHKHDNSPGVSLPLREGIRRRLTMKQAPPPPYNNHQKKKCRRCRMEFDPKNDQTIVFIKKIFFYLNLFLRSPLGRCRKELPTQSLGTAFGRQ